MVKRTVNSATKRYIEYIKDFDFGTDVADAIFVDSSLTFTGATSTLAGAEAADQTTITLADASSFPGSGAIKIGTEVITYSGKSTNDLTGCVRGVVGAAAAHSSAWVTSKARPSAYWATVRSTPTKRYQAARSP